MTEAVGSLRMSEKNPPSSEVMTARNGSRMIAWEGLQNGSCHAPNIKKDKDMNETITVKELKKLLKEYPDDAEVLLMKDWDNCPVDEDGNFKPDDEHLVALNKEMNFVHQRIYCDEGMDWSEIHQLIIG